VVELAMSSFIVCGKSVAVRGDGFLRDLEREGVISEPERRDVEDLNTAG